MSSALRSALLGSTHVARETITVAGSDIEVRGLTAGARGRLLNSARNEDGSLNFEQYFAALVIEASYDPEEGTPIFTAADLDAVNGLPVGIVEKIAETAQRLSGLGESAESLAGNSVATASAGSASDSPSA